MINNDWEALLRPEFEKPYYKNLYEKIDREYKTEKVYPPAEDVFNAFLYTPVKEKNTLL